MNETVAINFEVQYFDPKTKQWKDLPIESGTPIRMKVSYPEQPEDWLTVFTGKVKSFEYKHTAGEAQKFGIMCDDEDVRLLKPFEITENYGDLQGLVDELTRGAGIQKSAPAAVPGKMPKTIIDAYRKLTKIVDRILDIIGRDPKK